MPTVFDVASSLLSKFERGSASPLKLQKLVFYTFGWYGHLTGEELFDEPIYAMQHGPVVGPLLSAHQGKHFISQGDLTDGRTIVDLDSYTSSVVDAVMSTYGKLSPGRLVDMTHEESVWISNWAQRQGQRADLPHSEVIAAFQGRSSGFGGIEIELPDPRVVALDSYVLEDMATARPGRAHRPFVDALLGADQRIA